VREALDVFALQVGTNSLLKETTAASESLAVAPEGGAQCDNGIDDDGDGVIDDQDPGCHSDGNAGNPNSYVASDNDESNGGNSGTGGSGNQGGNNNNNGGETQCADGRDNDGDGLVDEDDPGCHEGNNINNPYNADDDSEGSDGNGGGNGGNGGSGNLSNAGSLPFTGTDLVGISLAGLLVLAGGLVLRRREEEVTTLR
jgi:LPXTG-motif cell wall-anchored protein